MPFPATKKSRHIQALIIHVHMSNLYNESQVLFLSETLTSLLSYLAVWRRCCPARNDRPTSSASPRCSIIRWQTLTFKEIFLCWVTFGEPAETPIVTSKDWHWDSEWDWGSCCCPSCSLEDVVHIFVHLKRPKIWCIFKSLTAYYFTFTALHSADKSRRSWGL